MSTSLEAPRMAVETEVVAKAARRRFTAAEKLRVLREADGCTKPGELSALLRREGLYSSHLSTWREARRRGELAGLAPCARGPQANPIDPPDSGVTSCVIRTTPRRSCWRHGRTSSGAGTSRSCSALPSGPTPERKR